MSEDEIIDILKNEISDYVIGNYCNDSCKALQMCENNDCRYIQAIDGIIDLYQKEKEKNKAKNIIIEKYQVIATNPDNYIHKDKIRELKQKLHRIANKEFEKHRSSTIFVNICGVEADIDELLEGNNGK